MVSNGRISNKTLDIRGKKNTFILILRHVSILTASKQRGPFSIHILTMHNQSAQSLSLIHKVQNQNEILCSHYFHYSVFPMILLRLKISNQTTLVSSYTFVLSSVADHFPNLPSTLPLFCIPSLCTEISYILSFLQIARVNKAQSFSFLPCLPLGSEKLK